MSAKIWILIVLAVVFVALAIIGLRGGSDNPVGPLDREAFVAVYVDLSLATEKVGIGTPEYEAFRDSLLAAHGTTSEEFIAMQNAYDAEPEKWAEVWEDILAELRRRTPDTTATANP